MVQFRNFVLVAGVFALALISFGNTFLLGLQGYPCCDTSAEIITELLSGLLLTVPFFSIPFLLYWYVSRKWNQKHVTRIGSTLLVLTFIEFLALALLRDDAIAAGFIGVFMILPAQYISIFFGILLEARRKKIHKTT
ncbi:hypothetical protein CL628_01110 [bacterium]|nr:hypothetical protein [bacterium]